MPQVEHHARTLRDEVVVWYETRLPKGGRDPRDGIWSSRHILRQLELLRAGKTVQLHRFGELDSLSPSHRPVVREHSLYELRGNELVPVPTWQPGRPPPREWTVPVTAHGLIGLSSQSAVSPQQF